MIGKDMTNSDALRELAANLIASLPEPIERARLRKRFGITQTETAKALRVSRRTIVAWEQGTSEPRGVNRERYAELIALWQEQENRQGNKQEGAPECLRAQPSKSAET